MSLEVLPAQVHLENSCIKCETQNIHKLIRLRVDSFRQMGFDSC